MNRTSSLSFFVVAGAAAVLFAATAQSQSGVPKNQVVLQPTTPGTSQSGHSNISGTSRAGQFVGGGAGVTNVNAALLNGQAATAFGRLGTGNTWTNFNIFQDAANIFNGNGNGLTNLSASNISVGTLADSRLSSNVALLTGTQLFTGSKVFNGGFITTAFQLTTGATISGNVLKSDSFGVGTWQPDGLTLPASDSVAISSTGLALTQTGTGDLAIFTINNSASTAEAVQATSNGTGDVFQSVMTGTGRAGYFSSQSGVAGYFVSASGDAIQGVASDANAYGGRFTNSSGGAGATALYVSETAVTSNPTYGVHAVTNGTDAVGVYGVAAATGNTGFGVLGNCPSTGYGVYAFGRSGATGTKSFRIDHPLDPENKYLLHYSSESPEPMNFYTGNVVTDANGVAWVTLPDYFDQINRDLRYTLTVVDDTDSSTFVMAKVAKKVQNNQFKIRTSVGNVEVSWRVDAVRNDRWVQEYGAPAEVQKNKSEVGKYQHPELYGQPASKGTLYKPERNSDN